MNSGCLAGLLLIRNSAFIIHNFPPSSFAPSSVMSRAIALRMKPAHFAARGSLSTMRGRAGRRRRQGMAEPMAAEEGRVAGPAPHRAPAAAKCPSGAHDSMYEGLELSSAGPWLQPTGVQGAWLRIRLLLGNQPLQFPIPPLRPLQVLIGPGLDCQDGLSEGDGFGRRGRFPALPFKSLSQNAVYAGYCARVFLGFPAYQVSFWDRL